MFGERFTSTRGLGPLGCTKAVASASHQHVTLGPVEFSTKLNVVGKALSSLRVPVSGGFPIYSYTTTAKTNMIAHGFRVKDN